MPGLLLRYGYLLLWLNPECSSTHVLYWYGYLHKAYTRV